MAFLLIENAEGMSCYLTPSQLLLEVGEDLTAEEDRRLFEGLDSQLGALRQLIVCVSLGELGKIGDVVRFLPQDVAGARNEQSSDIDQRPSCVAAKKSCHTEAIGIDRQLERRVGVRPEREGLVLLDDALEAFEHDYGDIDVVLAHVFAECFAGVLLVDSGTDASG